jgi:acetyl esterase/lipase
MAGSRDGWRLICGRRIDTMVGMDPELEPFVSLFPPADLSDPVTSRERLAKLIAGVPAPDTTGLRIENRTVPGDPDVPVRIYRPHQSPGAIVWLHGGGFIMGDLDTEHPWATMLARGSGVTVISVDYRLAPEHPFPAALDDVCAVLTWTAEHAAELGIDPERIAIGGHSAGAGLAAAVALRARDEQGPPIRFQLLHQAGLDDRQLAWSARNFTDTPFVTCQKVAQMWGHYLGSTPATPYAAPARATDLSGLPAAYVAAAEFCPNRDEDIDYAVRLMQAGVSVELHQWRGTFHGSQAIVSAEVSQRQNAELAAALRRGLAE